MISQEDMAKLKDLLESDEDEIGYIWLKDLVRENVAMRELLFGPDWVGSVETAELGRFSDKDLQAMALVNRALKYVETSLGGDNWQNNERLRYQLDSLCHSIRQELLPVLVSELMAVRLGAVDVKVDDSRDVSIRQMIGLMNRATSRDEVNHDFASIIGLVTAMYENKVRAMRS